MTMFGFMAVTVAAFIVATTLGLIIDLKVEGKR